MLTTPAASAARCRKGHCKPLDIAVALALQPKLLLLDEPTKVSACRSASRLRPAGGVSGGQGKMVALGRALTVARKVLLLDEPFQGLAPALALDYARTLGELRKRRPDLAMLITESSPALLDRIADVTLQIERGEILSSQTRNETSHADAI